MKHWACNIHAVPQLRFSHDLAKYGLYLLYIWYKTRKINVLHNSLEIIHKI